MVNISYLKRSHEVYMDWLWNNWGYSRWSGNSHRMIFWYGTAGVAFAGGTDLANKYLALADKSRLNKIPVPKRRLWNSAKELAARVRALRSMEVVPWLAQARVDLAWGTLQEVELIGLKVASWIMRDVSYLTDYYDDGSPVRLSYANYRDSRWFRDLGPDGQKYFLPIDRWAFRGAKKVGALSRASIRRGFSGLQASRSAYLQAAAEIAEYASQCAVDARDLNTYWYMVGSKWINEQGYEIN